MTVGKEIISHVLVLWAMHVLCRFGCAIVLFVHRYTCELFTGVLLQYEKSLDAWDLNPGCHVTQKYVVGRKLWPDIYCCHHHQVVLDQKGVLLRANLYVVNYCILELNSTVSRNFDGSSASNKATSVLTSLNNSNTDSTHSGIC